MDLELKNVEARIPGTHRVLFRVMDLKIPVGTRLCVHGPSGQGKTTFLHLLAGLLKPDAGIIRLGNDDFSDLDERARDRIRRRHFGIIFQQFNLLGYLTPIENVFLGLPAGEVGRKERAQNALARMGLEPGDSKTCNWLSQGERQRVAVARVLAAEPQVILADEPTSSLDEANAAVVMDALMEVSESATLVVVSHDQRIRARFSQQIDFAEWAAA